MAFLLAPLPDGSLSKPQFVPPSSHASLALKKKKKKRTWLLPKECRQPPPSVSAHGLAPACLLWSSTAQPSAAAPPLAFHRSFSPVFHGSKSFTTDLQPLAAALCCLLASAPISATPSRKYFISRQ
ncbi:hypothetical protein FH972_002290 [Carpinus fangiana]|uniref:Uncharacterized protein n=1 Tax=Carpinus fangiana TaxID=176857 RepID=A0A5N6QHQ6_9ROSI|nr:hypothetical protein FH972_002290 [Carpinus fangiana]